MPKWYKAQLSDADPTVAEVAIYDDIGYFGISAADFLGEIRGLGKITTINLLIDSNGGSVDDAIAMFNILKRHPAQVNAKIDAVAASAATLVAMAADKVQMPANAAMLIHNPMSVLFGLYTAEDMREEADATDKWRELMIRTYSAKAKLDPDEIGKILDSASWLTAEECVEAGFADEVLPLSKAVARVDIARLPGKPPQAVAARFGKRRAAGEKWTVGAARDLPTSDRDSWDGPAAAKRMLDDAAGADGKIDGAKAKTGFLIYDSAADTLRGSYKLPIADMIDGKKTVTAGGVRAAASRLPQTDAPQDVIDRAQGVLDAYKEKLGVGDGNRGDDKQGYLARAKELLVKAQALPDYDPDGDGDNDAQEALGLVQSAMTLLEEAASALSGEDGDEDAAGRVMSITGSALALARKNAQAAQQQKPRAVEIAELCKIAGLSELAPDLILSKQTVAEVRVALADERAKRDEHTGHIDNQQPSGPLSTTLRQNAAAESWVKAHERAKQIYGMA